MGREIMALEPYAVGYIHDSEIVMLASEVINLAVRFEIFSGYLNLRNSSHRRLQLAKHATTRPKTLWGEKLSL